MKVLEKTAILVLFVASICEGANYKYSAIAIGRGSTPVIVTNGTARAIATGQGARAEAFSVECCRATANAKASFQSRAKASARIDEDGTSGRTAIAVAESSNFGKSEAIALISGKPSTVRKEINAISKATSSGKESTATSNALASAGGNVYATATAGPKASYNSGKASTADAKAVSSGAGDAIAESTSMPGSTASSVATSSGAGCATSASTALPGSTTTSVATSSSVGTAKAVAGVAVTGQTDRVAKATATSSSIRNAEANARIQDNAKNVDTVTVTGTGAADTFANSVASSSSVATATS